MAIAGRMSTDPHRRSPSTPTSGPSASSLSKPLRASSEATTTGGGPSSSTTPSAVIPPMADPETLLDSIESYVSSSIPILTKSATATNTLTKVDTDPRSRTTSAEKPVPPPGRVRGTRTDTPAVAGNVTKTTVLSSAPTQQSFDPIEFLNQHYASEQHMIAHLPKLRAAASERIAVLDDSISTAIQMQADRGDKTARDVARAKSSIARLHHRIQLVQSKAATSERTVLDITRDMKRLDYAKKHLQQTITALKRLHMLIYAVDQLERCVVERPMPKFREGAHLIDATRLLLRHFENYGRIPKIRIVRNKVESHREEIREYIFEAFRLGASNSSNRSGKLGVIDSAIREEGSTESGSGGAKDADSKPSPAPMATLTPEEAAAAAAALMSQPTTEEQGEGSSKDGNDTEEKEEKEEAKEERQKLPTQPLDCEALSEACLVIDALGPDVRSNLIDAFCDDQLVVYVQLFSPDGASSNKESKPRHNAGIMMRIHGGGGGSQDADGGTSGDDDPAGINNVERRFAWYRRLFRSVDDSFEGVFPKHWKVQYCLTVTFLKKTREHFLALLRQGPTKDRDSENVTILLKALQKTKMFEREMTAWLQRDYGTVFQSHSGKGNGNDDVTGEDGQVLEFDEHGKGVSASSAEGIKIKYNRQLKARRQQQEYEERYGVSHAASAKEVPDRSESYLQQEHIDDEPVPSLLGRASGAFDNFMGPYIALESENMEDMINQAPSDKTVDTRGELPVFTSSTNLFIYMKNSIQRCTVLTKGRTFFLLYKAFCDSLTKYAAALSQKYPSPVMGSGISGGISLVGLERTASSSTSHANVSYRIPPGEEVTICHVIDTCEYCAETIEGLQDLILDKMDSEYKSKIDMLAQEESFHDVTAKGLRILVSGLEKRTDAAFREMSSTNWGAFSSVGEESSYVHSMHDVIQPFVETVQKLLPPSYFKNFCDRFAMSFTGTYYDAVIKQKRISEMGTQQMLLDVYNLKTLLLKLPIMRKKSKREQTSSSTVSDASSLSSTPTAAPEMYVKMVTKEFTKIEILLKLVGTPSDLLVGMFKANWPDGTSSDLQVVMNLKAMKRNEQQLMLDKLGLDRSSNTGSGAAVAASAGSIMMAENIQLLTERSSDVAAKVNSDLTTMRQKVDELRMAFR